MHLEVVGQHWAHRLIRIHMRDEGEVHVGNVFRKPNTPLGFSFLSAILIAVEPPSPVRWSGRGVEESSLETLISRRSFGSWEDLGFLKPGETDLHRAR